MGYVRERGVCGRRVFCWCWWFRKLWGRGRRGGEGDCRWEDTTTWRLVSVSVLVARFGIEGRINEERKKL
jgi:hypothetical protein